MACANPYGEHNEPYTALEALTVDHINGGDRNHRNVVGRFGTGFYQWLKGNGYHSGFQILCANCNLIKSKRREKSGGC